MKPYKNPSSTRRGGLFVYFYLLPPALQGAIHMSALRAKIKDPAHQNINWPLKLVPASF